MKELMLLILGIVLLPFKLTGLIARLVQSQFMVGVNSADKFIDWVQK